MKVVLDTNIVVQMFGARSPLARLSGALLSGEVTVVISTAIWLEYEEVVVRYAGIGVWVKVARIFELAERLRENVLHIEPTFSFRLISADPDDDKFADSAIAAAADFLITEDRHFDVIAGSGHKPQTISPAEFISRFLP